MTKFLLCPSTFPKPLVGFSKSLCGIFPNPEWSFLASPPSCGFKFWYKHFVKYSQYVKQNLSQPVLDKCSILSVEVLKESQVKKFLFVARRGVMT